MDTKQLNLCGKRKRKIDSNKKELQNDYFSKTGLQTSNFVVQSKVSFKNLNGLRRLRISTKIGWLFQNFLMKVFRISRANIF